MTDEQLQVPVEALRRAADLLLTHVETSHGAVIPLDADYFWSIPPDQRGDVTAEPDEFTIGQLSESLEHLERILGDPSQGVSYALVWLADVLRAVGEATVR